MKAWPTWLSMLWEISWRADPKVRPLADRHYNRQKVGADQFAPPGRCLVLKAPGAFWITSYPYAEHVRHAWAGAFVCSAFRNESSGLLSSTLVRQACAATRWYYGLPVPRPPKYWIPRAPLGMVTFIDKDKTTPKEVPGWCYIRAGFKKVGETEDGLDALHLPPHRFPPEVAPLGATARHKDYCA